MFRRRVVWIISAILFILLGCGAKIGIAFLKTQSACKVFECFCEKVRSSDWTGAREMVSADPKVFRVEIGAVYYSDHFDVTRSFLFTKPLLKSTFKYYLLDGRFGDKVVFEGQSAADYVTIRQGKICYVKFL
jgi:hypothetical protein